MGLTRAEREIAAKRAEDYPPGCAVVWFAGRVHVPGYDGDPVRLKEVARGRPDILQDG